MGKGYRDPTADLAVGHVMRKEKERKQLFKRAVEMMARAAGFQIIVTFVGEKGEK